METIELIENLIDQTASLLIYQNVLAGEVGAEFITLLQTIQAAGQNNGKIDCLRAYGRWFRALATCNQSWQDYLLTRILRDDNPFTQQAQQMHLHQMPPALVAAAQQDLQRLQNLYECSGSQISQWLRDVAQVKTPLPAWNLADDPRLSDLRSKLKISGNWAEVVEHLATHYRNQGTGLFAEFQALRWQAGKLVGIAHPDPAKVDDLVGYELQKEALLKNTEFLLQGYPALHVLLYGSRGSGKSSLIKGLLHQYSNQGLRMIEVAKSHLQDLPTIVEQLRDVPQKFIVFVDDLSFEADEEAYKALKVVLEGNLTARPQNVVVYATSNRRHLIREFFGDRPRPKDADEVNQWDTVQEKLSFSDRFGLTLTFEPADQTTYLKIIHHLAAQAKIPLCQEELEYRALQWATRHNGRSGRTARQFIDFLRAELATGDEG